MTTQTQPFQTLSPWLGVGAPCPPMWQSITEHEVMILVGLTGVGKTTTVEALTATGLTFANLPNRRIITDHLIIGWLQAQDGQPIETVRDRTERFDYTRRYRQIFAGGMAHALSQLWVNPQELPTPHLLFDGLRGENEVKYAAELLPNAFFIVLDAPNDVRIQRLLGRDDSFDQVETSPSAVSDSDTLKQLSDL
ncbi:MAG: AAA family ATPase, partial [Chloroflexota bacterium]